MEINFHFDKLMQRELLLKWGYTIEISRCCSTGNSRFEGDDYDVEVAWKTKEDKAEIDRGLKFFTDNYEVQKVFNKEVNQRFKNFFLFNLS